MKINERSDALQGIMIDWWTTWGHRLRHRAKRLVNQVPGPDSVDDYPEQSSSRLIFRTSALCSFMVPCPVELARKIHITSMKTELFEQERSFVF